MTKLWENPCESASFGDWDSKVEEGPATIVQSADAAWPGRGGLGLRLSTTSGDRAYVRKDINKTWGAGKSYALGFLIKLLTPPSTQQQSICNFSTSGSWYQSYIYLYQSGQIRLYVRDDNVAYQSCNVTTLTIGQWSYVAVEIYRASGAAANDGIANVWVDGKLLGTLTNLDIFTSFATFDYMYLGTTFSSRDDTVIDYDEPKIATTYPELFVPKPRIFI